MKKTTYTASVYYLTDGEQQSFENLSAENAEAINAQAHAGLDLHWFAENEGTMYEYLIPWEAVLSVTIVKEVTDETAPTDSICEGGEAPSALNVVIQQPTTRLNVSDNGSGCIVEPDIWEDIFIESVTLNGEDVRNDFVEHATAEVVGATYGGYGGLWDIPIDCGASGTVTYTIVYTYEGESTSVEVTQPINQPY